jgi:hypothetical protein
MKETALGRSIDDGGAQEVGGRAMAECALAASPSWVVTISVPCLYCVPVRSSLPT